MPKARKTRSVSYERDSRGSPYPRRQRYDYAQRNGLAASNGGEDRSHGSPCPPGSSNGRVSGSSYPISSYSGRCPRRSTSPPSSSNGGRLSRWSPYPTRSSNGRHSTGSPHPPASSNGQPSRGSRFSPCSSDGHRASQQPEQASEAPPAATKTTEEWEQVRCPVCMEHPHNAVLLVCSSHDQGCRPFMCDTSHRHSNCLDQYRKSAGSTSECSECQQAAKLTCPLCRGTVTHWNVVKDAREYMNSKVRSCSKESCEFKGVYKQLREHARSEHPTACPSEVDPERQQNWQRMERQRDFEDLFSMVTSGFPGNDDGEEEEYNGRVIHGSSLTMLVVLSSVRPGSIQTGSSIPGGPTVVRRTRAIFVFGEGSRRPAASTAANGADDVPVADDNEDEADNSGSLDVPSPSASSDQDTDGE